MKLFKLFLTLAIFLTAAVLTVIWVFSSLEIKKELGISIKKEEPKKVTSTFAIFSDTHSDLENTKTALERAKSLKAEYVIHNGDWTNLGTLEELTAIKKVFEESGLPYRGVPGDHDLWQSLGTGNFEAVFGKPYQSFDQNNIHHILLDTSDTKKGLGQEQIAWLKKDLAENKEKNVFLFMQLPLYHPYNSRTIWEKGGENESVKKEVDEVLPLLKKYAVKAVFAGDHHLSSDYEEPTTNVKMYIVGAVTSERNLQKPRFSLVRVFEDGSFEVKDIVL